MAQVSKRKWFDEQPRQQGGLDSRSEAHVVTVLMLTERFSDGAELRDAFSAVFPQASEAEFLTACHLALQVLSPERLLFPRS